MTLDPVVAITDASEIGCTIASHLVTRGWRVAIYHPLISAPRAEALVQQLGRDRAHRHQIALETWETLQDAVEATKATFGQAPQHAVISIDRWDGGGGGPLHLGGLNDNGAYRRLAVNADAVYAALRVFLPTMVEARSGSIVVLGSRMGERTSESAGAAAYAAAKAAALALARTAAQEVLLHGVRVNSIVVSMADSPDARAAMPDFDPARWVSPDAIAKVVGFLVSDDASAVTGAAIPLYGHV
jgi:NAD(P)-dependent dehydrogenase (short-subunit alcohol dehydrogenase family)